MSGLTRTMLVTTTAILLSACGTTTSASDAPVREAAAISVSPEPQAAQPGDGGDASVEEPASAVPLVGSATPTGDPLEAGVKSTNVCVDNQSGETLSVTFTKYDTRQRDTSELRNNVKTCAEGTFLEKPDVAGTISRAGGGEAFRFAAINYALSYPQMALVDESWQCGLSGNFSTGDTRVADDGNLRFTVTRDPDTNWKQFRITVSPSQERVWRGGSCR